jgi:hypothetical protein
MSTHEIDTDDELQTPDDWCPGLFIAMQSQVAADPLYCNATVSDAARETMTRYRAIADRIQCMRRSTVIPTVPATPPPSPPPPTIEPLTMDS